MGKVTGKSPPRGRRGNGNGTWARPLSQRGRPDPDVGSRPTTSSRMAVRSGVGEAHTTAEPGYLWWREGASLRSACTGAEEVEIGMSLQTPERIRTLQRKLYVKAKEEPTLRFYLLYDKVYREDILAHAYALARHNGGAPGVDGVSFKAIEAQGLEAWLAERRDELRETNYK